MIEFDRPLEQLTNDELAHRLDKISKQLSDIYSVDERSSLVHDVHLELIKSLEIEHCYVERELMSRSSSQHYTR